MYLSKQQAQEDIAQLVHLLTGTHPDPYSGFGGTLAFHRTVARVLNVPEEGLTQKQFLRLLRPFVAGVKDGHTMLYNDSETNAELHCGLLRHGAEAIGVPSMQAGNCFIDALTFTLTHSKVSGCFSFKVNRLFPDDPICGKLLPPDRELTYQDLVEHRFDPHTTVRVALERLGI